MNKSIAHQSYPNSRRSDISISHLPSRSLTCHLVLYWSLTDHPLPLGQLSHLPSRTVLVQYLTGYPNSYIEELCVRHRRAEVLNLNLINREVYTSHGMHLRSQHKHLLAEFLLESVKTFFSPTFFGTFQTPDSRSQGEGELKFTLNIQIESTLPTIAMLCVESSVTPPSLEIVSET
ncbi:hypothetical protein J6590_104749 [Homalodisca vitripennis]|nr:hypothetical protein J6590_104749 [Homalodisca vitripennis]